MSFTVVPRGPKPQPSIPLHWYMYRACRNFEHITRTVLTCAPTEDQYLFTNIVRALRNGADELECAIEFRIAEDRAARQEQLTDMRKRERPQITLITKGDASALMSKRICLDEHGQLQGDASECRMVHGTAPANDSLGRALPLRWKKS